MSGHDPLNGMNALIEMDLFFNSMNHSRPELVDRPSLSNSIDLINSIELDESVSSNEENKPKRGKKRGKSWKRRSEQVYSVSNYNPDPKPVFLCKDYYFKLIFNPSLLNDSLFILSLDGLTNGLPKVDRVLFIKAFPDIICDIPSNHGWKEYRRGQHPKIRLRSTGHSSSVNTLQIKVGRWIGQDLIIETCWTIPITLRTKAITNLRLV